MSIINFLPTEPDPADIELGIEEDLNTFLGIFTAIGPYVFLGGVLLGCLWLVFGMFGHGEVKGFRFIGMSLLAATLFGGATTLVGLFI